MSAAGNGHAGTRSRLVGMVRQRCPRCLAGRVFRGVLDMNERCPLCGYRFGREAGYFTGAMYASTILSLPLVFGIFLVLWAFSTKTLLAVEIMVLVTAVVYIPLVPIVWRYSRVAWMYFDWRFGPDRRGDAG